jgi:hypothetical protein
VSSLNVFNLVNRSLSQHELLSNYAIAKFTPATRNSLFENEIPQQILTTTPSLLTRLDISPMTDLLFSNLTDNVAASKNLNMFNQAF